MNGPIPYLSSCAYRFSLVLVHTDYSSGVIVDCAYYNNLKALGKALVHSGDELDGRKDGVDEKVTLNL